MPLFFNLWHWIIIVSTSQGSYKVFQNICYGSWDRNIQGSQNNVHNGWPVDLAVNLLPLEVAGVIIFLTDDIPQPCSPLIWSQCWENHTCWTNAHLIDLFSAPLLLHRVVCSPRIDVTGIDHCVPVWAKTAQLNSPAYLTFDTVWDSFSCYLIPCDINVS